MIRESPLPDIEEMQPYCYLPDILNANNGEVEEKLMATDRPLQSNTFSVTNLRVAFECPRLFYLGQRFGGMTLFLPPNQMAGTGKIFHDLAKQFIILLKQEARCNDYLNLPPDQINPEIVATQMQQLFYELVFLPYLQETIQQDSNKVSALHQIWQGLRGLIRRYAEILVMNRRDPVPPLKSLVRGG